MCVCVCVNTCLYVLTARAPIFASSSLSPMSPSTVATWDTYNSRLSACK